MIEYYDLQDNTVSKVPHLRKSDRENFIILLFLQTGLLRQFLYVSFVYG